MEHSTGTPPEALSLTSSWSDWGSVADWVSNGVAGLAAIVALGSFVASQRALRITVLSPLLTEYSTPEMGDSLKKVLEWQRNHQDLLNQ
jgi:hypothetical protein